MERQKEISRRYDEGCEDAELDLEMSGLPAKKLLVRAEIALAHTSEDEMDLREYRMGKRDRLKEAEEEARYATGAGR